MKLTLTLAALLSVAAFAAANPRIFITEGGAARLSGSAEGEVKGALSYTGGTSSENVEVMKAFQRYCPDVAITSNRDKADFVVRLDREAPSPITPFVKSNKVAVFNRDEDLVFSDSTRLLPPAVKGACAAIQKLR